MVNIWGQYFKGKTQGHDLGLWDEILLETSDKTDYVTTNNKQLTITYK